MAEKMTEFCNAAFGEANCSPDMRNKTGATPSEKAAIQIANTASAEIKQDWPH